MGHKAAAVVTQLGPESLPPTGDHLVVLLLRSCGRCFYCTIGRPYNCDGKLPQYARPRLRKNEGVAIACGLQTAGFAECLTTRRLE